MPEPLIVVPTFLRKPDELAVVHVMLKSLREHEPDPPVLIVDDGSPAPDLVDELEVISSRFDAELYRKPENEGFSRTVNVGLRRALQSGQDAVLVNSDIEFREPWLKLMVEQPRLDGKPGLADVVGALLIYPTGLIQHGGIFFSFLARTFGHIHQFAPENLPEAHEAKVVPVTGALQFIRHSSLERWGLYDEDFRLSFEDVDYCIRVLRDGGQCVYQPRVRAYHHESLFRGMNKSEQIAQWEAESWVHFKRKWAEENFAFYCPSIF